MSRKPLNTLTPTQLAKTLGVSRRTLANWRSAKPKRGPGFVRDGRDIFYPLKAVAEYKRRRKKLVTTSESRAWQK